MKLLPHSEIEISKICNESLLNNQNLYTPQKLPNYSALAYVYDTLMEDVNYEAWADYLDELIQIHAPEAEKILELGCGTGSVALSLDELGYYDITATDKSPEMIGMAKKKEAGVGSNVKFEVADFLDLQLDETFDLAFLVFDSVNYLHTSEEIRTLLMQAGSVLKPGGLFIFDFTTPKNSRKAIQYLHREEGISPDNYRFYRTSNFDGKSRIHTNEFHIEQLSRDRKEVLASFTETHKQKAYTLKEIEPVISGTPFQTVSSYADFGLDKPTRKSLRITLVCQWPTTQ